MTCGMLESPYIGASLYLVSTDSSNAALTGHRSPAGNTCAGVPLGHGGI